jgi:hypothetical protein
MFGAKFVARDECVLIRANVVIIVRPIVDPVAAVKSRFGREWRPADVILARAPGNPRRAPLNARHPDPADPAKPHPSPVMVGGPAKRLIRNPRPPGIAINPPTLGVGTPVTRFLGHTRLPNITVTLSFSPVAVRLELLIKHSVSGRRAFLRPDFGFVRVHRFVGRFFH